MPAPTTLMLLNIKKLSLLVTLLLFSLSSFSEVTEAVMKQSAKQVLLKAEQGDAEAQHILGILHIKGFGVVKSTSEAVKWFQKSAESGNANAQHNLGVSYYHGRGIRLDKKKAMKWYRKSAEQGYLPAQRSLAKAYILGEGVLKDPREALKWFVKAAQQNDPLSQFKTGMLYMLFEDKKQAKYWIKKAYKNDYPDAEQVWNEFEMWNY